MAVDSFLKRGQSHELLSELLIQPDELRKTCLSNPKFQDEICFLSIINALSRHEVRFISIKSSRSTRRAGGHSNILHMCYLYIRQSAYSWHSLLCPTVVLNWTKAVSYCTTPRCSASPDTGKSLAILSSYDTEISILNRLWDISIYLIGYPNKLVTKSSHKTSIACQWALSFIIYNRMLRKLGIIIYSEVFTVILQHSYL